MEALEPMVNFFFILYLCQDSILKKKVISPPK